MARRLTIFRHNDFSGGVQTSTSRLLRKTNELYYGVNAALNTLIGALSRRLGQTLLGTVQANKDGLGSFVHRYSAGSRLYAATNNSGDSATVVKYWNGSSFSTLGSTSYAAGTRLSAVNYLDELYLAGYSASTDTFADTANVDSTPSFSTTRNVNFAPRAKIISEFQGRLYASNVEVNVNGVWIRYPDRSYVSSYALGAITYVQSDQSGALTTLKVDSTKYLKVGMVVDIYQAGTETTRVTNTTITAVSKNPNSYSISFAAPYSTTFITTAVNTATDVITLGSTTNFPTGTPIVFSSTTTLPAPLTAGTIYYAINLTGTTIKVATSAANALGGTAIDLTDQGTGTHTINVALIFTDNDEIWLAGRKNKLSILWNTDFPTPESSDYLRIPPGQDENSAITAVSKINNRQMIYTTNSFSKWDGQNLVPVSTSVGCPASEGPKQIGTWMIWPHYTGIWGYNDNSGQLKLLSRAINDWVFAVPIANFPSMSSGTYRNQYKLAVGNIPTYRNEPLSKPVRFVYDFDMNNWMIETHTRTPRYQYQFTISTSLQPVFQDDVGNVIVDNSGNTDLDSSLNPVAIPLEGETGRTNFGWDEEKAYNHLFAYAVQGRQAELKYSIDGGEFKSLGQIRKGVQKIVFPSNTEGHDISYKIEQSDLGDPLILEGLSTHYALTELTYA